jgi:hypothetical protein
LVSLGPKSFVFPPHVKKHSLFQAEDGKFDKDDFTVYLQPLFLDVESPDFINTAFGEISDLSYFAPDCFHFSQKGNAQGMLPFNNRRRGNWQRDTVDIEQPALHSETH